MLFFIYNAMRLFKFSEFILESKSLEYPFVVSDELLYKFKNIESPISGEFIKMFSDRITSEVTLLLSGDSDDTVKYIDSYKLDYYLRGKYTNASTEGLLSYIKNNKFLPDSDFWYLSKTEIKIGRLIRKLFGSKFTDSQVEEFVNKFKSFKDDSMRFEIWKGREIKKAYSTHNYPDSSEYKDTTLFNSCMNDMLDYIDFYSYCDVSVLVLLDTDNKIYARALVWKDTEGRTVMDRVYYIFDKDYYKYVRYANDNSWYYKSKNTSGSSDYIKDGVKCKLESEVKIPDVEDYIKSYGEFPYMDTYFYAKGNRASNTRPKETPYYRLVDTEGAYDYIR